MILGLQDVTRLLILGIVVIPILRIQDDILMTIQNLVIIQEIILMTIQNPIIIQDTILEMTPNLVITLVIPEMTQNTPSIRNILDRTNFRVVLIVIAEERLIRWIRQVRSIARKKSVRKRKVLRSTQIQITHHQILQTQDIRDEEYM